MIHMRFIEVPPGTVEETDDGVPRLGAGLVIPAAAPEPEEELEIDEDFLRRVRDV